MIFAMYQGRPIDRYFNTFFPDETMPIDFDDERAHVDRVAREAEQRHLNREARREASDVAPDPDTLDLFAGTQWEDES